MKETTKWKNRIIGHTELDPKTLVPNPENWRLHPKNQQEAMEGALDDIGWVQEITINQRTGLVVDGHLRLDLALREGEPLVPVKIVDLSPDEEAAVLATLDPISAMAKTDKLKLKAILEISKSSNDKMRQLLEAMKMKAGVMPKPRVEHVYEKVETEIEVGQIFKLGKHTIACGDSTDTDFVSSILSEEMLSLVFTSPPYNAGATPTEARYGKESKYKDDSDAVTENEFREFLDNYTETWLPNTVYLFTNMQSLAGNKRAVIEWLYKWRFNFADEIIWDKLSAPPAMADNVLDSRFEHIYIHKEENPASRKIGTKKFRGVISNVYAAPVQRQNDFSGIHNATFPLHLPTYIITSFTNVGDSIGDPFLGTGTTLIAAEENGRICYGSEINPEYCELAIRAFELKTGIKRELV